MQLAKNMDSSTKGCDCVELSGRVGAFGNRSLQRLPRRFSMIRETSCMKAHAIAQKKPDFVAAPDIHIATNNAAHHEFNDAYFE